jgi:hypothetical protein
MDTKKSFFLILSTHGGRPRGGGAAGPATRGGSIPRTRVFAHATASPDAASHTPRDRTRGGRSSAKRPAVGREWRSGSRTNLTGGGEGAALRLNFGALRPKGEAFAHGGTPSRLVGVTKANTKRCDLFLNVDGAGTGCKNVGKATRRRGVGRTRESEAEMGG